MDLGIGPTTSADTSVPAPFGGVLCTMPLFFVLCFCAHPASQCLHLRLPFGPNTRFSRPDVVSFSPPSITCLVMVSSRVLSPQ